jgi:hypothetical protein
MSNDLTLQPPPRVSSQEKLLTLIQEKHPNYHPVVALVDMAHESELDSSVRFQCHKEVAKYVVAVDKFVEVKHEVKQTKRVVVELFGGPEHPRATALEANGSPVLEVTDVSDKMAARSQTETLKRTVSVTSTGPADEPEESKHDRLLAAWGDGTSPGAERFT